MAGADSFDEDELRVETTTIMFADVVESVRLIAQNEAANVVRIRALLKLLCTQVIPRYDGEVLERRGDGLLVKFGETRNAAACALDLHAVAASASFESDPSATIALRIGIHSSSVLVDESAIYGQGINLAARVAALAGPGETIASGSARDALTAGFDADIEDLGDCYVKHVSEPIRAFRLGTVGVAPVVPEGERHRDGPQGSGRHRL